MIGTILRIVLILMPFLIYVMWLRAYRRQKKIEAAYRQQAVEEAQGRMVRAIGLTIAVVVAVILYAALDKEPVARGSRYVPPHTENGKLVPGAFIDLPPEQSEKPDQ